MTIDQLIKQHGLATLRKNGWHRTKTAKELGVCVRSLSKWIRQWRIEGEKIPFQDPGTKKRYLDSLRRQAPMDGKETLHTDE